MKTRNRLAEAAFPELSVSLPELVDAVKKHAEWVAACLRSGHEAWAPQLAVTCQAGPAAERTVAMYSLMVNFNENHEKQAVLTRIARDLYRDRQMPVYAVMSSEVWVAPDTGIEPRHHPDRKEAVVVFGSALLGEHAAATRMFISRDSAGLIVPNEFEAVTERARNRLLEFLFAAFLQAGMRSCDRRESP